jgi:Lrp/AsnC family transcriptional regulator for asnA, asnC and gidA
MYRPDAVDRQIICCLQKDGRRPYVDLARALGISEATARRRVERLISEGVLSVVACVEPHRVGLEAEAMVYLQADLDKLTQIGQRLAAMPEVREVLYTSGTHDLVLKVVLPSGDALLPFLTRQVAPIPGIKATQTSYVLHTEKRPHEWQLTELPAEKKPAPPSPRILIVDDDADFVAAARMVLEAEGFRVIVACNGREALACLHEEAPDMVLLDLIMETPLAGLEVARALTENAHLRGVPILAISAIRSTEWAGKLPPEAELPFDGFLDKPIEPGILLDKVHRLVEGSRAH